MSSLAICLVVRNEERVLARCLRSLAGLYDEICLLDTGSVDATLEIAREFGARVKVDTSCNDVEGRIADFSIARNAALEMVRSEWLLQIDADEVLEAGADLIREIVSGGVEDAVLVRMISAGSQWHYPRLLRRSACLGYRSPIHEYMVRQGTWRVEPRIRIVNLPDKEGKEDSSERNVRIARLALQKDPANAWLWYRLGTEFSRAGEHHRAEESYRKALAGELAHSRYNALCGLANALWALGRGREAYDVARQAVRDSPRRAEAMCLLGEVMLRSGDLDRARTWFEMAASCVPPQTELSMSWLEAYDAFPRRRLREMEGRPMSSDRPSNV